MHPIEQTHTTVEQLSNAYRLDESGYNAVAESYEVFRRHHGPFIASVAAQMLPDLHRDAALGGVVVFLGRDGHSFAAATRALDPQFFREHCTEVVLSRVVAETAIQDLETTAGEHFPQIEAFRQVRARVEPADVPGAYRHLTSYLRDAGVPVGKPHSRATVVDSRLKGTVQELLSAAYPQTAFTGRYAFYAASPEDPHLGAKHGYVVNLRPEQTHRGIGTAFEVLPEDPALTFAQSEALSIIEDTLHGPLGTPFRLTETGPRQIGQRDDAAALVGFNPVLVPERFRDPLTREAVKAAALLAVYDSAEDVAGRRDRGEDWQGYLQEARYSMTEQSRAWIRRDPAVVDPQLATVLDSTVRRSNHRDIARISEGLAEVGVDEQQATPMWRRLAQMDYAQIKVVADVASRPETGARKALKNWVAQIDTPVEDGIHAARTALQGLNVPKLGSALKATEAPHEPPKDRSRGPER